MENFIREWIKQDSEDYQQYLEYREEWFEINEENCELQEGEI